MKVLLVSDAYLPLRKSVAALMSDLAAEMVDQGHEPTVVTLSSEIEGDWSLTQDEAVEILRVRIGPIKSLRLDRLGLLRRAFAEISLSWRLWHAFKRTPVFERSFDAIVWYSPTIFLGRFVAKVARLQRCPRYLVLRDIFPRWAVEAGILRKGVAYWLFRLFEKYQYRVASVVGVESPGNLPYFDLRGPQPHPRVEVLRNWVRSRKRIVSTVDERATATPKVLAFGGTMGPAQDMNNILRLAARLLSYQHIKIVLVGSGSDLPRLKVAASKTGLTNVEFMGEMAPFDFEAFLSTCFLGLISLDRRLTSHNIPGKLLSYLESGLPVVASVNPENELKKVLEQNSAGFVCVNGDDDAFASAVLRIVSDASLWREMSANASKLGESMFSASTAVHQIAKAMNAFELPVFGPADRHQPPRHVEPGDL
jgi:glycosyltransferase involved in cell wall biosynthesis